MPPDGHCLFSCAVAARDVRRLRSLRQDAHGIFLASRHEDLDLLTACRRLRALVGAMAAEDARFDLVEELSSSKLPEGPIIEYVARWLHGSTIISLEGASSEYDTIVGDGPIACRLLLGVVSDAAGHESPHFCLAGSWLPQRTQVLSFHMAGVRRLPRARVQPIVQRSELRKPRKLKKLRKRSKQRKSWRTSWVSPMETRRKSELRRRASQQIPG